ncbi:MAG: hypothetical protein IT440_01790 [Phycisphaeraceae bacterium]|nr:hypothetical protein [Phycisphaeraceae bacterium]
MTALTCGVPDRVPINTYELAGRNSRDWYNNQESYRSLMDFVRQHTDCVTNWNAGAVATDYISFEGILGSSYPVPMDKKVEQVDGRERTTITLHTPKGDIRTVHEVDPNIYTVWRIEHFCKNLDDVDKALSVPFEPMSFDASDYPRVKAEIGDHGLIMSSLGDPAYMSADLMSFQDYVMWLHEDTDHFARTVDIVAERMQVNLKNMLDSCVVDLYRICGPEYMTLPYARSAMFERFMVPHLRNMTELIHRYGAKVRLHCHGKIAQVLDMFFETGVDGTDPCEPPPDGDLPLDEVKRRCAAHHVSVWGNVELKLLEHGSMEDVRRTMIECLRQAKAGGGYVVLPTAGPINLPLARKTEDNYKTMIETVLEHGVY